MNNGRKYSILIVDDIESIRFAIADYLKCDFNVLEAENGLQATRMLVEHPVDLVITDIRMPEMGGLELIAHIARNHPQVKFALMTAYNTNDYIRFVRTRKIWNIIPKTTFLDLHFLKVLSWKLLTGDIFGVEKYYPRAEKQEIDCDTLKAMACEETKTPFRKDVYYSVHIGNSIEESGLSEIAANLLIEQGAPSSVLLVLDELVSNALIRAPIKNINVHPESEGRASGARSLLFAVAPPLRTGYCVLSFGILKHDIVFSVLDPYGTLDRDEILYRLERHVVLDNKGLPIGINDAHGRGLFISRENTDHLIFNIQPGHKTEVIGILALNRKDRYRAISIYQNEE